MGRVRPGRSEDGAGEGTRFGPRVIDLDLLLFGDQALATPALTLPHPRMRERAFVLRPLWDLAPDLAFPDGESLARALAKLEYRMEGEAIFQPAAPARTTGSELKQHQGSS